MASCRYAARHRFAFLKPLAAENPETTPQANPTVTIRPELSCQSGCAAADAATSTVAPAATASRMGPASCRVQLNESICS